MALELECMSREEIAQSIKSTHLERAYEQALRQAERIYEDERARVLRVQLLLLEDENYDLQEKINENDADLNKLEDDNDELRQQLVEVEEDLLHKQTDLKARMREIDHFRAEVTALNESSSDATKLLSEKLALSRQLATLKPELEHLKSQSTTQQNLLAEKLALQRELSSVQVELDTEKRTVQRIKAQEKTSSREDSALTEEIGDLKKELVKAQREAQKNDREGRKKITEWESQKEILEGKLDAFRNKLRTTKEQLKDAQDEVEKLQAAKMAQSAELMKARLTGINPKKRNVARFDPDMTIGTPGHGGPSKKQRTSVSVGDKSTFSMTPFLNRTMSILPESPDNEQIEQKLDEELSKQIEKLAEDSEKETTQKPTKSKSAAQTPSVTKPKTAQPLKESTNSKANTVVQKPRLAKLAEEDDENIEQENTEATNENTESTTTDPTKKKQKVLNKRPNIFDETDDIGAAKAKNLTATSLRGGGSSFGKVNLAGLGKGKSRLLAEFSPLKKDRRTAGAQV